MTAFDERLDRERAEHRLPSVVATVVTPTEVLWTGASGTRDGRAGSAVLPTTRYRIGSITKTLVAVAILRSYELGRLDLTSALGELLDDVGDTPCSRITVAQLLSHTSGLQAETGSPWWERSPGPTWPQLRDSSLRLVHPPGTRFHYSNVGFAVLGRILEQQDGRGWFEVVREQVLAPLGLADAMSLRPDAGAALPLAVHPHADLLHAEPEFDAEAMAPAGQLWTSIEGLGRWTRFALSHGEGVLRPETMALMQVPLAVDERLGAPWESAQTLGWRIWPQDGRRLIGHGGSMPGFLAALKADPQRGVGAAVLTNTTHGMGDLVDDLLRLADTGAPEAPGSSADEDAMRPMLGDWYWGPAHYVVEPDPVGFLLRPHEGPGRSSRFVPDGEGWRGLDGYYSGERLVVRPDGALDLATFIFTRHPYDPAHSQPGGLDPAGWH